MTEPSSSTASARKPWGGRFSESTSTLMEVFNASIGVDRRLYREDIEGSQAHARMLAAQGIITAAEAQAIVTGLDQVRGEIEAGTFSFDPALEDIHMAIETRLTALVGAPGGRLHTARSRNDQVATDVRLYLKRAVTAQRQALVTFLQALANLAERGSSFIMPGFTHLQPAQPVTLGFWALAHFQSFRRDYDRLGDALQRIDCMPLGSGALAGVNYPIDREHTARSLGFAQVMPNAMDAVSARDFMVEYLSGASIIMVHLSRLAEELILWSTPQFGFITLADAFTTGSSIMPNKKNPDACELIRGKAGRVFGDLAALLALLKGLPLAYNKDLQEDKERLFDAVDTVDQCLAVMPQVISTMQLRPERMRTACEQGFLQATDLADYLVTKGLPFREAHHVSGSIVKHLETIKSDLAHVDLATLRTFSPLFAEDVLPRLALEQVVAAKRSAGSTAPASVAVQLSEAHRWLSAHQGT